MNDDTTETEATPEIDPNTTRCCLIQYFDYANELAVEERRPLDGSPSAFFTSVDVVVGQRTDGQSVVTRASVQLQGESVEECFELQTSEWKKGVRDRIMHDFAKQRAGKIIVPNGSLPGDNPARLS